MLINEPIYTYPENAWYVFAWARSDQVVLDIVRQHFDLERHKIATDPTLTTGEREDLYLELLDQEQLSFDWYAWDYCDCSRWFATRREAVRYYQSCVVNPGILKTAILDPEEFESAMSAPQDHRVHYLKKYLLKLRDGEPPRFRIRIEDSI